MRFLDVLALALGSLTANYRRTLLIVLATTIGVGSVLLLSGLGEGARRFVTGQFESLGTNLLIVIPGRNETVGGTPPLLGETPRDLTIEDAFALPRHSSITRVAPVMVGSAPVSVRAGLEREVTILGSTSELAEVRNLQVSQGKFLPAADPKRATAHCVLGYTVRSELFRARPAVGQWVRIGDRRFRVVGVLAEAGVSVSVNFDDVVIVQVAAAQALFNRESLFRILAEAKNPEQLESASAAIHSIIAARHQGEDDVTVITQDSVVKTLGRILNAITYGLAGISAISLAVAGILIMNVMLVSVAQRRAEIGLMKALGATVRDIRNLFICEALLLSVLGAAAGLLIGLLAAELLGAIYPVFPIAVPRWAMLVACSVAVLAGLAFGVSPARRAAALDPIEALSRR